MKLKLAMDVLAFSWFLYGAGCFLIGLAGYAWETR